VEGAPDILIHDMGDFLHRALDAVSPRQDPIPKVTLDDTVPIAPTP
jgi:hypothetical protein